jgi:hypothetical protein
MGNPKALGFSPNTVVIDFGDRSVVSSRPTAGIDHWNANADSQNLRNV